MTEFGKAGITERLELLDDDLLSSTDDGAKQEISIVGGSALMLLGLSVDSRVTTDIDVMEASRQAESLLERYDMNQDVTTFRFRLPENWKSRRCRIPFAGAALEVYSPSPEDLAILKLDAYRDVDRADLKDMLMSGKLNLTRLQGIVDDDAELRVNFDDENEWREFLVRLEELKELAASLNGKGSIGE
jgi:hypothetical protein